MGHDLPTRNATLENNPVGDGWATPASDDDIIGLLAAWNRSGQRLRKSRHRALKLLSSLADERYLALGFGI